MISEDIYMPFFKYLDTKDPHPHNWEKIGLVSDAPSEAIKAYEIFKKMKAEAKAIGALL